MACGREGGGDGPLGRMWRWHRRERGRTEPGLGGGGWRVIVGIAGARLAAAAAAAAATPSAAVLSSSFAFF